MSLAANAQTSHPSQAHVTRLMASARGFHSRLDAQNATTESEGQISLEIYRDIERAGLHRFVEPVSMGGYGLPFEPFFQLVREMAGRCPSTAWVYVLYSVHNWMIQFQTEAVRDLLYEAGSPPRLATSFVDGGSVKRVDGGWYLKGNWPYVTAVAMSDWVKLKAHVEDSGELVHVFIRPSGLQSGNDWDVPGLQGTASHSVSADCILPEVQVVMDKELERAFYSYMDAGKVSRVPMDALVTLGTVAPIIGATRSVVSAYENRLRKELLEERLVPTHLERFSEMSVRGTALEVLFRESARILDLTGTDKTLSEDAIAGVRMNAAWIARQCRDIASSVSASFGTRHRATGSRLFRDVCAVEALSSHYLVAYDNQAASYALSRLQKGLTPGSRIRRH